MWRPIPVLRVRTVVVISGVLLAAAACGSGDDGGSPATTAAPTATSASVTVAETIPTASTIAPDTPTSTLSPVDTTVPTTVTEATATTVLGVDTEAPAAPANVTCAPGGGSQEVLLEWDAPSDPGDVVDVRLYVNDGSGFARLNKFTVDSGQVLISATRWSAVAYPVPVSEQVQMAVTFGDAAGNESGWNPIDVFYEYSGADCVS